MADCVSCDLSLTTEQWGGCACPVWDCCGDIREVKATVTIAAAPPALNAGAADYAPGTIVVTPNGTTWAFATSTALVQSALAQGVVVCAPIHKAGQTYPAVMEIVIRTAETGIYDNLMLLPAAFAPADKAIVLAVMQSNGFKRKQIYA